MCLVNAGCLDDVVFTGDSNHECGDLTGNATGGARAGTANSQLCLDKIDCVFMTQCATSDVATCYCGSLVGSACATATTPGNGLCAQQECDGSNHLITEPASAVSPSLGNSALAAGRADAMFSCALGNTDATTGATCASICGQ